MSSQNYVLYNLSLSFKFGAKTKIMCSFKYYRSFKKKH